MGSVSVKMTKTDLRKLQQIVNDAPEAVDRACRIAMEEMLGDMKQSMIDSPRTGATYKRGKRSHVASSPGNAPRPDMGALIGSLHWERTGHLRYRHMDGVEYGVILELILDRPFVRPVYEDWGKKIVPLFKSELNF